MILTVTLNPAVDKTCTTASLMLGQVNRMRTVTNIAGGKGINVSRILRQYGYPVMAAGFLGGYAGEFIESCMNGIHAESCFTHIEGETRTSINVIAEDGYVTELLEPGPVVTSRELEKFICNYKSAVKKCELVILSGSVARGIPADIYRSLILYAKEACVKCILDTSGEALRYGIEAAPFMVKPNQKELEYLAGHRLKDMEEITEAAQRLRENGTAHVFVSMGKKGILSVSGEQILWAKAPCVKTVNTVGCGDSVVASFAMSHMRQEDEYTTVKRAAAISAANAATLENGDILLELAEELLEKVPVERGR